MCTQKGPQESSLIGEHGNLWQFYGNLMNLGFFSFNEISVFSLSKCFISKLDFYITGHRHLLVILGECVLTIKKLQIREQLPYVSHRHFPIITNRAVNVILSNYHSSLHSVTIRIRYEGNKHCPLPASCNYLLNSAKNDVNLNHQQEHNPITVRMPILGPHSTALGNVSIFHSNAPTCI
jgi:hypothetical protein